MAPRSFAPARRMAACCLLTVTPCQQCRQRLWECRRGRGHPLPGRAFCRWLQQYHCRYRRVLLRRRVHPIAYRRQLPGWPGARSGAVQESRFLFAGLEAIGLPDQPAHEFLRCDAGAQGNIYEVNQASTDDPYANPPNWNANGDPVTADDGRVIDELWHASINSRGEFINAKTPTDVTDAMRRVLSAVSSGSSPSGTFAQSGARIGPGSLTVVPMYDVQNNGTDWFSRLTASQATINPTTREVQYTRIWEASEQFPAATARNVYFNDAGTVRKFGTTTVSLAGLCGLSSTQYPAQSICNASTLTALGLMLRQRQIICLATPVARSVLVGGCAIARRCWATSSIPRRSSARRRRLRLSRIGG